MVETFRDYCAQVVRRFGVADSLIKHVNLNSKIKASNTNKNTWNSINKFSEDEVANNISILKEEPIVIEDTDSNSI